LLNNLSIVTRIGNLFAPILKGEVFDVIVSNPTSLPSLPDEEHDEYTRQNIDAGADGRKYIDPVITQAPEYLSKAGYLLIQHSNFANIEKTLDMLDKVGFKVDQTNYEFPIGKTSRQRISYFLENLPANCHPFQRDGNWYQRIAVFIAQAPK
ncbi:unnamed protein product, partial [marine sediment metagenome]